MADDHTSGAEQKGVITKVLNPPIKGAHYTGHEIHDALRFQGISTAQLQHHAVVSTYHLHGLHGLIQPLALQDRDLR
jgi:hypothetical protein